MPLRDPRATILVAMAAVTMLAWAYLFDLSHQMSAAAADDTMMAAMGMAMNAPWTPIDLALAFVMWAVMMIGMMAPSATPMLLLAANAPRDPRRFAPAPVVSFAAGYALVWTAFSAIATIAQWALHDTARLSPAMAASSSRLSGAILIAAGLYQLTPLKQRCLTHCRSPIDFLMAHWRGGRSGPLRMGVHHGVYCLGCCWALMAVLFAVGVMNLAWVALIALLVLAEKIAPAAVFVSRAAGVALAAWGAIRFVSSA